MNARDRIAEAIAGADRAGQRDRITVWRDMADAVLAVLPDLLTDPDVVQAARQEAYPGMSNRVITRILAAAARAITGDQP